MCKLGDRCNYTHGDPQQMKLQKLVDANISPLEKDLSGYRIASDAVKTQGNTSSGPSPGGYNNTKPNAKQNGKIYRKLFSLLFITFF